MWVEIEAVTGSCTLTRSGVIAVQIKLGDLICQGDILETAIDGKVAIRFIDGTVFNLSDRGRFLVKEFAGNGASPSALFDISRGTFAFIAGDMAKTGRLDIDTPFASIRGRTRAGGIGSLSLVSFFFAAMEEVQAASPDVSHLEDGIINVGDSQEIKDAPVGRIEVIVPATQSQPEQHYFLDDATQSIVLRKAGNSTSVSYVQNSLADLTVYQNAADSVMRIYALGQGPAGYGNGGSSTLFEQHTSLQPINLPSSSDPNAIFIPPHTDKSPSVEILIPPLPPPLQATPDVTSIDARPDFNISGDVVSNDTRIGGGTLTVTAIENANGTKNSVVNVTTIEGLYGTLTIFANGIYHYDVGVGTLAVTNFHAVQALGANQSLADTFTYTVTNGAVSAQTTLTVSVVGVNDAPVANADTNFAQEGASNATGNVLLNQPHAPTFEDVADTDVDNGTTLTVTAIASNNPGGDSQTSVPGAGVTIHGQYGALTINPNGSYSYVPNANINNPTDVEDIFTYTVTDGTGRPQQR